ncbi:hypothetical protein [Burkholderia ubonensis]|uniref:hypothetical protein n=1 Tax=Burkholderia ubonensis TaxID=101571 RepID=UPI000AC8A710|nr:hypothetical protein [Burkholderia ubonensis]
MSQKSRLYSAMLRERRFTVKQLADAAGVNGSTARTVVSRTPSGWLRNVEARANVKGAPTKVYELTEDGISHIRASLEDTIASVVKASGAIPDVSPQTERFLPLLVAQECVSAARDYLESGDLDSVESLLDQSDSYLQRAKKLPEASKFGFELLKAEKDTLELRLLSLYRKYEKELLPGKQRNAPNPALERVIEEHVRYGVVGYPSIANIPFNRWGAIRQSELVAREINNHGMDASLDFVAPIYHLNFIEHADVVHFPSKKLGLRARAWTLSGLVRSPASTAPSEKVAHREGVDASSRSLISHYKNRQQSQFSPREEKILILDGDDEAGAGRVTPYLKAALKFSPSQTATVVVLKYNEYELGGYEKDLEQYKCMILPIDSRSNSDNIAAFVRRVGAIFSAHHIPTYVVDAARTSRVESTASSLHASYISEVEDMAPPELLDRLR